MVAAEKDVAAAREAANRERARREAAMSDLEGGLREVAKQRELLREREEMWKEDIRAMEREVQGAMTQVRSTSPPFPSIFPCKLVPLLLPFLISTHCISGSYYYNGPPASSVL
jgi:hypothetical protein